LKTTALLSRIVAGLPLIAGFTTTTAASHHSAATPPLPASSQGDDEVLSIAAARAAVTSGISAAFPLMAGIVADAAQVAGRPLELAGVVA
jgi:hypothetical protein